MTSYEHIEIRTNVGNLLAFAWGVLYGLAFAQTIISCTVNHTHFDSELFVLFCWVNANTCTRFEFWLHSLAFSEFLVSFLSFRVFRFWEVNLKRRFRLPWNQLFHNWFYFLSSVLFLARNSVIHVFPFVFNIFISFVVFRILIETLFIVVACT